MQENEPNFEKHIDDIVKAIGDKLERNVIANELRRFGGRQINSIFIYISS